MTRLFCLFWIVLFALLGCSSVPDRKEGPLAKLNLESFLLRLANTPDEAGARAFLKQACSQNFLAACDALGEPVKMPAARLPILQGGTDDTATELLVLASSAEPVYLVVWGESVRQPLQSAQTARTPIPGSDKEMTHFLVEGLTPRRTYRAQWLTRGGALVDSRSFSALDTERRKVRMAVASCLEDFATIQKKQWAALLGEKPDVLFLIGDNVYADLNPEGKGMGPSTPAQLWRRYLETRSKLDLFFTPTLVPTFAIWDDHDFGVNDGTTDYPHKDVAREVFSAFFGMPSFPGKVERGPGVGFRLEAFGQMFFFLDGRSYRTLPESKFGASATHFGRDTEAWLFAGLDGRTPTWLISGDQFFGGYHPFESFEGMYPTAFKRFLGRLRSRGAPVVFLSGDRHLSEVMRIEPAVIGYETYEFTSSALHAKTYPGSFAKHPNPRQIAGRDGEVNFMVLDVSTDGQWEIDARALGEGGRSLYRLLLHPADPTTRQ